MPRLYVQDAACVHAHATRMLDCMFTRVRWVTFARRSRACRSYAHELDVNLRDATVRTYTINFLHVPAYLIVSRTIPWNMYCDEAANYALRHHGKESAHKDRIDSLLIPEEVTSCNFKAGQTLFLQASSYPHKQLRSRFPNNSSSESVPPHTTSKRA